jgi:hypothetical protein
MLVCSNAVLVRNYSKHTGGTNHIYLGSAKGIQRWYF